MKRALYIAAVTAASVLAVLLLVAGLTQTALFKDRLRAVLVSNVSERINGTLVLGTIDGNFLTGVTVDSVAILDGDEPVLTSGKVTLAYDVLGFFRGRYKFTNIILEHPSVRVRRSRDGVWNISRILKPNPDTSSGAFTGTLHLADLQVRNASFLLADSVSIAQADTGGDPHRVRYTNFTVRDLNLHLSALVRGSDINLVVRTASFASPEADIVLGQFGGEFTVGPKGASAKNVVVKTLRSSIELDASMKGIDLLKGVSLPAMREDSVRLRLNAANVDLDELQRFLPQLAFLRGNASLDLDADGIFGDITVRRLQLHTRQSTMHLAGAVRNLHDPVNLTLDVVAGDSRIELADLAEVMPEFRIPSFRKTGPAAVFLEFKGKPLDFRAAATLRGKFGALDVRGTLDLTRERPAYNVAFGTQALAIEEVTGDPAVSGSLTAHGTAVGQGFALASITGTLDMTVDSSRVNDIPLGDSRIRIDADNNLMKLTTTLHSGAMAAEIRGTTDWSQPGRPAIAGEADLEHIDIARLLHDQRFSSDLSMRGSARGSGSGVDDATGTLDFRLLPSRVWGHELDAQEVRVTLDQENPAAKRLTVSSEVADVDISGRFDLVRTPAVVGRQASGLVAAVRRHALPPDTGAAAAATPQALARTAAPIETGREVDFSYTLHVKNLGTIATMVEGRQFDAKADLRGTVRGTEDRLALSCEGTVNHFFVGKIDSGMIFNDATVSLRAEPITLDETLERLAGSLDLRVGSCVVNGRAIDSVAVALNYARDKGTFSASGVLDSSTAISLQGQASVQPNTYVFDVEHLTVGSTVGRWENDQDVQVRLNHEGVRVLHAVMTHGEERLAVAGILRHTGEFDMEAGLSRYDLRGINAFIRDLRRAPADQGFSGHANAHLLLAGTTAAPRISFTLRTDSTYFRRSRIGQIDARIDYADEIAAIDLVANERERDTIPDLAIRGTVPVNLAFTGVERRFPDREQRLAIKSEGFDVSVLDPLIWELDRLSGSLTCDVTIGGTPRVPEYRGTIALRDLAFLFMPNNVAYTANGSLEPSGDKLVLKDLVVKNAREDRVPGEARFEGSITIKDYTLHTFDITMFGRLLVMNDATRKIIPTMYGTLYAAPDAKGLNLSGTLARPFLSGNLEVLDANIIFPPTRLYDVAAPATIASLGYVVVDDTTTRRTVPLRFPREFYAGVDSGGATVSQRNSAGEPALLDRLRYNLVIETKGTTAVKMIFTPNEELYAEMEGKVSAINDQGTPLIYGEVAISSRSYYNFLKKFDATGSIKFVGPWDNPELNIVATYEGYRQGRAAENDAAGTSGKDLKTVVTLNIGGTRYEPQLKMSMKVQLQPNGDLVDWSTTAGGGDVQSDAISFIVTGKFREDLTSGERAGLAADVGASTTTTVVSGFTSNLLSGILDNFVRREFPFIRSVDVSYRDGSPTVNVGASPGLGYLRVGGRILNNLNNTNVSYQVSMGDIFNSTTIRNLFLEIQRRVENDLTGTNREDITNEARLYYRFSF
jgi:hypothetical protein